MCLFPNSLKREGNIAIENDGLRGRMTRQPIAGTVTGGTESAQ